MNETRPMNYSRNAAKNISIESKLAQVQLWQAKVAERALAGNMEGMQEAARQLTRWQASADAKMVNNLEVAWNYSSKCGRFLYCEGETAEDALNFSGELIGLFDTGELTNYEQARKLTLERYPQHATSWKGWDDGVRKASASRMAARQSSASPKTGKKK